MFRFGGALCAALLLSLALIPAEEPQAQVPSPPNILLIVTDDQPVRSLSAMPDTARLIRDAGINFKKAIVPTPLCCPSRASIMTGQYAHNHGVRQQNGHDIEQRTTIQRYLHHAGYQTAAVGKFLNNLRDDSHNALRPDHFDRWTIMEGNAYHDFPVNDLGEIRTEPSYRTTYVGDRTVDFLTEFEQLDDAAPWYAWVGFNAPHAPGTPQKKYKKASVSTWRQPPSVKENDRRDKPAWVRQHHLSASEGAALRKRTLRTLMSVDDQVSRLVSTLRSLEELDNTIIVFTSDNGFLLSDHGVKGKRFPYRNSVRIPLYVRWPAQLRAGGVRNDLVSNIDLAPLFLEAAGIRQRTSPPMDGRSPLTNPPRERLHVEYFKIETRVTPTWRATLSRNSYYIESFDETGEQIFEEFYRINKDPWMLRNVLHDGVRKNDPDPETLLRLQVELQNDQQCAGSTCP